MKVVLSNNDLSLLSIVCVAALRLEPLGYRSLRCDTFRGQMPGKLSEAGV